MQKYQIPDTGAPKLNHGSIRIKSQKDPRKRDLPNLQLCPNFFSTSLCSMELLSSWKARLKLLKALWRKLCPFGWFWRFASIGVSSTDALYRVGYKNFTENIYLQGFSVPWKAMRRRALACFQLIATRFSSYACSLLKCISPIPSRHVDSRRKLLTCLQPL